MNKTELVGYRWLLSQGYSEKEIVFQRRKTPDFITSDGRGYEIKLKRANTIVLFESQFKTLIGLKNTFILVFGGDDTTPIVIPSGKLSTNKIIDGVNIHIIPHGDNSMAADPIQTNKVELSKMRVSRVDKWGKVMISRTLAGKNILWIPEDVKS